MAMPSRKNSAGDDEIYTPKNCLVFEKNLLKAFGIYPLQATNDLPANKLQYFVKYCITFSFSLGFFASIWTNIAFNMDDPSVVIETLYFGLTQTTFIVKLFNFHLRYDAFTKAECFLYEDSFNSYNERQQIYIQNANKICIWFARIFRVAITTTIIFFALFPFLDNKLLPLPSWFPISVERFRYILFVYQMISICMNGYCHSALDVICSTLITMGAAQFRILCDNLENMRDGFDDGYEDMEATDEIILQRLGWNVYHQSRIIQFVMRIEDMFSPVQFFQFLASSIIMCVTGFQMIVTPFSDLKFITLLLYFNCNFIQVLFVCWFGHYIKTKSEGVSDACYMSKWYYSGPKVGRTLFIIMERAKRPIVLTAGKFFGLTLQTFMQVLKTSYSYLALLKKMNEVREL